MFDIMIEAHVKGGEKEKFNPLTGLRYERGQTHDLNKPDEVVVASTSATGNKESYVARRGRPDYYKRGGAGSNWSTRGRSNSPYQRPRKDSGAKASGSEKPKDKQQ